MRWRVGGRERGCARVPAGRGRWRSAPPRGPSSGRMLSSCRARIASRGSRGRGTPAAAGTRRMRIAASAGTLLTHKLYFFICLMKRFTKLYIHKLSLYLIMKLLPYIKKNINLILYIYNNVEVPCSNHAFPSLKHPSIIEIVFINFEVNLSSTSYDTVLSNTTDFTFI